MRRHEAERLENLPRRRSRRAGKLHRKSGRFVSGMPVEFSSKSAHSNPKPTCYLGHVAICTLPCSSFAHDVVMGLKTFQTVARRHGIGAAMVNDGNLGLSREGEPREGEPNMHRDIFVVKHKRILVVTARSQIGLTTIEAAKRIDLILDRVGTRVSANIVRVEHAARDEFAGCAVTLLISKQDDIEPSALHPAPRKRDEVWTEFVVCVMEVQPVGGRQRCKYVLAVAAASI